MLNFFSSHSNIVFVLALCAYALIVIFHMLPLPLHHIGIWMRAHTHNVSDGLCNCNTHRNLWAHTFDLNMCLCASLSLFRSSSICWWKKHTFYSSFFSCVRLSLALPIPLILFFSLFIYMLCISIRWCVRRIWVAIVSIHESFLLKRRKIQGKKNKSIARVDPRLCARPFNRSLWPLIRCTHWPLVFFPFNFHFVTTESHYFLESFQVEIRLVNSFEMWYKWDHLTCGIYSRV